MDHELYRKISNRIIDLEERNRKISEGFRDVRKMLGRLTSQQLPEKLRPIKERDIVPGNVLWKKKGYFNKDLFEKFGIITEKPEIYEGYDHLEKKYYEFKSYRCHNEVIFFRNDPSKHEGDDIFIEE